MTGTQQGDSKAVQRFDRVVNALTHRDEQEVTDPRDAILAGLQKFTRGQLFAIDEDLTVNNRYFNFRVEVLGGQLWVELHPALENAIDILANDILVEVQGAGGVTLFEGSFKLNNTTLMIPIEEKHFPYSVSFRLKKL